eukprot:scaffold68453_cov30-Tisochrysis_lutea.AAC.1
MVIEQERIQGGGVDSSDDRAPRKLTPEVDETPFARASSKELGQFGRRARRQHLAHLSRRLQQVECHGCTSARVVQHDEVAAMRRVR